MKGAGQYFAAGTRSCWVIDPVFRLVHVFDAPEQYRTFQAGRDEQLTDAVMNITLSLGDLFR